MDLSRLERALGYQFSEIAYLRAALTHRSFGSDNNERLEFLGDGLLNFIVAESLFLAFPELPEGDLSRLRASLVRQDSLFARAREYHLGVYLQLGEGERKSGGHARPSILADAFEALVAAIYRDAGFEAAAGFVRRSFAERIKALDPVRDGKDAKTRLQEYLQARNCNLPKYSISGTDGAAHAQHFEVRCQLQNPGLVTVGRGTSRRIAEQQAAQAALDELGE